MQVSKDLKERIKVKSRQLGFSLAGVTTPDPPPHFSTFEQWLALWGFVELRNSLADFLPGAGGAEAGKPAHAAHLPAGAAAPGRGGAGALALRPL